MRKYYCHRQICTLLLLLLFVYLDKVNGQITQSELESAAKAGVDPNFVETRDTVSKYGPWHITRDLLQDKNGNFWFATWQGIMKYDGKLFTNYTLKEGLIHFHVISLFEDKKGNLWFGTARGGLYRYNGASFTLFTTKDGLAGNNVLCMTEDEEGNIWVGTENGASRYNGKTFTNFTTQDGLSGNFINSIIQDKTGKIWFGTMDGITCYDGRVSSGGGLSGGAGRFSAFTNEKGLPIKKVLTLFEDKTGNIWIGRYDGLTRYDGKSFTDFLSDFLTYYIIEDKAGNILLTHSETNTHYSNLPNQVLYRYDGRQSSGGELNGNATGFTKIIEKYEPNDFQIFGKIVDRDGNIWFGTMHGPCRYDGKSFTYFADKRK